MALPTTKNKSLINRHAIDIYSSRGSRISLPKCSLVRLFDSNNVHTMPLALESIPTGRQATTQPKSVGWFCLRTQPKHEHLAAAHLRKMDRIEVFLPRIRFKRPTRQALAWVTEALFPGYLFARFDWSNRLRQVQSARGIRNIVHFGEHWPVIPAATIDELRDLVGTTELQTINSEFSPGDAVLLTHDSLRGLRVLISRVLPGQKRVEVLMEILGRQTGVELPVDSLVKEGCQRAGLFRVG